MPRTNGNRNRLFAPILEDAGAWGTCLVQLRYLSRLSERFLYLSIRTMGREEGVGTIPRIRYNPNALDDGVSWVWRSEGPLRRGNNKEFWVPTHGALMGLADGWLG